ncbi:synaptonemal complex protein 1 [Diretmus argenteus]
MQRDRGFNFKLLVPPRVALASGQVSAVRPQEVGGFPLQQGYSKYFDKEPSLPFPSASMVEPTKPTRHDIPKRKVVPPMEKEEINHNPAQLYPKLFDEVAKIKCWKVKVDSETVQRERKLLENKRTIETQRKAIQELQFGNESLSIKLEEQICENEDLTNKNNATRNLCNILKDTFQRSTEKMDLFESEREETHHLFMENSENIQKMIAAFESLRIQAEADQHEMQKAKEGLLQFEDLKDKFNQEYNMKQEQVAVLQTKLKDKENELQKLLRNLHETQASCKQLQETSNQQHELLKSSKNEQESLLQKLQTAEQHYKVVTETSREAIAISLKQSKEDYVQVILNKESNLQELNKKKDEQADKLVQIQSTVQELQSSLTFEIQRANELDLKLMTISNELERKTTLLGEAMEQSAKKDGQIKILEDELDIKAKSIESLMGKTDVTKLRVQELTAEVSRKTEEAQLFKNKVQIACAENNLLAKACEAAEKAQQDLKEKANMTEVKVQEMEGQLLMGRKTNEAYTFQIETMKKDIMQHEVKYEELLSSFNELQSEKKAIQDQIKSGSSEAKALEANLKSSEEKVMKITSEIQRLEEENQSLREDVDSLNTKIQEQYQETDNLQKDIKESCDLQEDIKKKEKKIKEVEAKLCSLKTKFESTSKAQGESQKEINNLKDESHDLKILNEEKHQRLLEDLGSKSTFAAELQNEVQTLKDAVAEATKNKEDAELMCRQKIADMVALMEKHTSQYDQVVEKKDAELEENKRKETEAVAKTSLSYRIRTPPSTDNSEPTNMEHDPKSDRSEPMDIWAFTDAPVPSFSAPQRKAQMFKKLQTPSPALSKSPGKSLKLAAIKRMRDAGWIAATGYDKKKKNKSNENIFA